MYPLSMTRSLAVAASAALLALPATASAAVSATIAPSSARGLAFSALRFQTVVVIPSRSRLRAIPAPMIPVPSTATDVMPPGYP